MNLLHEHTCMSRLMTKRTKWLVRPAKTQTSLGICPVWSESSLSAWRKLGFLDTHWAHSEDSDQSSLGARAILFVLSWGGSHVHTGTPPWWFLYAVLSALYRISNKYKVEQGQLARRTNIQMSLCMTKQTKWPVRPVKTQIRLIRVFAVRLKKVYVFCYP